jgi:hypothetical protein
MKQVMAFISALLPQLTALGPDAAQLIPMFRAAFAKIGGRPEDFDRILAENQLLINQLGDPDRFFKRKPADPGQVGAFPYSEELTSYPDESHLQSGDKIHQYLDESRFIVIGNIGRDPDADGWHLVKAMP